MNPLDAEVGRMRLQHERGVRPDGIGIVRHAGPVGRAHLAQPGPRRFEQVRQPEPVPDLDQLTAAHNDLARAAGQRGRRQHQGGGVVVHQGHGLRGRHGGGQRVERAGAPPSPDPERQVELDVAVARRGHQGFHRRGRQRRPAQVGVHEHAGGVDHRDERGGAVGQLGDGRVRNLVRCDLTVARPPLRPDHRRLDQIPAQPGLRRDQPGIGKQQVGTRHEAPGVHVATIPPPSIPPSLSGALARALGGHRATLYAAWSFWHPLRPFCAATRRTECAPGAMWRRIRGRTQAVRRRHGRSRAGPIEGVGKSWACGLWGELRSSLMWTGAR